MKKYQIVVLRSLKGFGQFVTESRDEVNTYELSDGDERPVIFGEKLKAVERRTIMRKVREVLEVKCWLTTHKKGGDAGISGLCMSCPACVLFGGTYAPKKGGAGGPKNVVEMRRAFYTAAFPFQGGGIRDVTFNAVDERTGQTGQALGTNQVIEPRDFIDVITVEADDANWVKLLIWGIEHSDRYGANTRIYGEIHNSILGVFEGTRIRLAAIDLARLESAEKVKKHIEDNRILLKAITCDDNEVEKIIWNLVSSAEVEDLARRKNQVDLSVADYFKMIAEVWDEELLKKEIEVGEKQKKTLKYDKWDVATRVGQLDPSKLQPTKRLEITRQLKFQSPLNAQKDWQPSDDDRVKFLRTQYGLARVIESAVFVEGEDEEEVTAA